MSVTHPRGFRAAGVAAGLKASGGPDVALIVNDGPLDAAAAVWTSNRCRANPVLWSEQAASDGAARAVIANSGGANCFTGPEGFATTHATAEEVAGQLGISASDVLVCSTGLIGLTLPREAMLEGSRAAVDALDDTGGGAAATAIMTTDSVAKTTVGEGDGWSIGGIAKGAGMLAPGMATMLVFLTTDAEVSPDDLDRALRHATALTVDRLDSDGCMSTNDSVIALASGASGVAPTAEEFADALTAALDDLTRQLQVDAEGSEHDIDIRVVGAASEADAVEVARSVSRSNLFKCAIFGRDPNWGRILAAIGTTQAHFDPADLDVSLGGVMVCRNSGPGDPPDAVNLKDRQVNVLIDLKSGGSEATVRTNDLTHAYVHENSAYSS